LNPEDTGKVFLRVRSEYGAGKEHAVRGFRLDGKGVRAGDDRESPEKNMVKVTVRGSETS